MSYSLEAFVARPPVLARLAPGVVTVALPQGFALLPLTDANFAALSEGLSLSGAGLTGQDELPELPIELADKARLASAAGPLAWLAAESFGGVGGQVAAVWRDHGLTLRPLLGPDAIATALLALGVTPATGQDAFAALGLGRHRHTDDWLSARPDND